MDTISISRFKATCLAALDRVGKTQRPLLVTRRGVPVAKVVPPDLPQPVASAFGAMAEGAEEVGDILAPLPEGDWEAFA
ncbi:MAG: type II toxin-antitoxin system Phd/YefM family antitoxin [Candidatus Dormibacteria bacterium]